ncbi:MAG: hypothetical protein RL477_92 [Pseudomonadota bacterium]|jgi:signal transduction histidine kinase
MTATHPAADTNLLATCLDELRLGVAVFDANQELILYNPRFASLIRLPSHLLQRGTRYIDIIQFNRDRGVYNEEDRQHDAEKRLDRSYGEPNAYRTTLILPWGDVLTMRLDPLPQSGFLITYRRITRRRKAEHKLAQTLEEARAAAERADIASQSKTDFLATMSHELRTPLNAIIGFSDLLVNEIKGPLGAPEYREYVADIAESGRHLLSIINDLLDIAKIEAGKVELREENINIARIIGTCLMLVRGRAADGGIDIETGSIPDGVTIRADSRYIKQILLNLVSNAVKFTPRGGRIKIGIAPAVDGSLTIVIADTGIGIAPNAIERVLERFGQVENSHTRHYEGTGLGLPIAKSLVELHGGTLEIESEPGVGTTARVNLPPSRVRWESAPTQQTSR